MTGAPVTLLFTDLVDSTGLLQRVGDEWAQRILRAHRQLLREVLGSHGGREVKWLGDGLLTTFTSVADGVRCAVTMAQRAWTTFKAPEGSRPGGGGCGVGVARVCRRPPLGAVGRGFGGARRTESAFFLLSPGAAAVGLWSVVGAQQLREVDHANAKGRLDSCARCLGDGAAGRARAGAERALDTVPAGVGIVVQPRVLPPVHVPAICDQ
jgi:hypothetical protein